MNKIDLKVKNSKDKKLIYLKSVEDYWKEKSINQLSFFNNLLLTFSLGIITLAYKNFFKVQMVFSINNTDWVGTATFFSFIFFVLSIIIGFHIALSRLCDFRITRHICQVKYRVFKYLDKDLPMKERETYKFIRRYILIYKILFSFPKISINECKIFDQKAEEKLDNLRNIAYNLGEIVWITTILQTIFFITGLILFFTGLLL